MSNKIIINRVFKSNSTLYCDFSYKDKENTIFIKPEEQYADYLCDDRADSFFIILLYKAIREGCDLISKVAVSERLYYQATIFINSILAETYGTSKIFIEAPITTMKLPSENAVATGMTGGVDSLYTISSHNQDVTGGGGIC